MFSSPIDLTHLLNVQESLEAITSVSIAVSEQEGYQPPNLLFCTNGAITEASRTTTISRLFYTCSPADYTKHIQETYTSSSYEGGRTSLGETRMEFFGHNTLKQVPQAERNNPGAEAKFGRQVYDRTVEDLTTTQVRIQNFGSYYGFKSKAAALRDTVSKTFLLFRVFVFLYHLPTIKRFEAADLKLEKTVLHLQGEIVRLRTEAPQDYTIGSHIEAKAFTDSCGPKFPTEGRTNRGLTDEEAVVKVSFANQAFSNFLVGEAASGKGLVVFNGNNNVRSLTMGVDSFERLTIQDEVLNYNTKVFEFLVAHYEAKSDLITDEFRAQYALKDGPLSEGEAISPAQFADIVMRLELAVRVAETRTIGYGRDLLGEVLDASGYDSVISDNPEFALQKRGGILEQTTTDLIQQLGLNESDYEFLREALSSSEVYVERKPDTQLFVPEQAPTDITHDLRLKPTQRALLGEVFLKKFSIDVPTAQIKDGSINVQLIGTDRTVSVATKARAAIDLSDPAQVAVLRTEGSVDFWMPTTTKSKISPEEATDLLYNLGYIGVEGGLDRVTGEELAEHLSSYELELTYYGQLPSCSISVLASPEIQKQRIQFNQLVTSFFVETAATQGSIATVSALITARQLNYLDGAKEPTQDDVTSAVAIALESTDRYKEIIALVAGEGRVDLNDAEEDELLAIRAGLIRPITRELTRGNQEAHLAQKPVLSLEFVSKLEGATYDEPVSPTVVERPREVRAPAQLRTGHTPSLSEDLSNFGGQFAGMFGLAY